MTDIKMKLTAREKKLLTKKGARQVILPGKLFYSHRSIKIIATRDLL